MSDPSRTVRTRERQPVPGARFKPRRGADRATLAGDPPRYRRRA